MLKTEAERLHSASELSEISLDAILGYHAKSDLNFNPLRFSGPDATI
jgi:hypothetical protein